MLHHYTKFHYNYYLHYFQQCLHIYYQVYQLVSNCQYVALLGNSSNEPSELNLCGIVSWGCYQMRGLILVVQYSVMWRHFGAVVRRS